MSSKILDILAKRHNEWLNMAKSFKLNDSDANELVQEMYLRMYDYTKDIKRIMYNETEINTFYIYITLRNLYYSKFTNYNKKNKKLSLKERLFYLDISVYIHSLIHIVAYISLIVLIVTCFGDIASTFLFIHLLLSTYSV